MSIILTLFLALLSAASFYKDWYCPDYLRDKDGNPPQFPMPYVTMMACIGTGLMNLLVSLAGHFGTQISFAWTILIFIACAVSIAAELIPNIRNWEKMNWTSVVLIFINGIIFMILTLIY